MRIITINLNGIRSAASKGFYEWLAQQDADIICLQELKAQAADMTRQMLAPEGYHGYFHYAEKKGIAEWEYTAANGRSRSLQVWVSPNSMRRDVISVRTTPVSAWCRYICHPVPAARSARQSSSSSWRLSFRILRELRASGREVLICGDWNIAHREIDLKNWRGNKKNSGFLPEERAWLTGIFDVVGFVDVFRRVHPELEAYTWWSNRGQAWAKDVGWRIDYQIATPGIASRAEAANIYKAQRFSDHAPLNRYEYRVKLALLPGQTGRYANRRLSCGVCWCPYPPRILPARCSSRYIRPGWPLRQRGASVTRCGI